MSTTTLPKNFKASCKKLKLDPKTVLPNVSNMPADMQDATLAHAEMMINARAITGDLKIQRGQRVYWPVFEWDYDVSGKPVGFRFWSSIGDYAYAVAPGGSALFASREQSDYAGRTFVETYKRMLPHLSK